MTDDADRADPVRASLQQGLGSQYRVLRALGSGGMGTVYLARDEALERLVAIKVLRPELGPTAEGRERFRREARTAAQLNHPNVVPLLAFGEVDALLFLVMGYVRGEPLSARLRRDGRFSPDETRRILADVAEALDYAHRKGVVHRDVKPDNILIEDETGRAVLTDFGIAKVWGGGQTVTRAGSVIGTPHYMSPEQVSGQDLDGRSDIYSLGVVGYALLSGHLPFEEGTPQDVLLKRLAQDPPRVDAIVKGVPEDLVAAVARCLRRDREQRWPEARQLREAVAPTTLEAEQLPEPLDSLDGLAPFLLPFSLAFALSLFTALLAIGPGFLLGGPAYQPILALLVVLPGAFLVSRIPGCTSAVRVARRRGFSWRQIVGATLRQPEWWVFFWYPRPFRRAADVWDRLPRAFRVWRLLVTGVAVDTLVVAVLVIGAAFPPMRDGRPWGASLRQIEAYILALQLALLALVSLGLAMAITAAVAARDLRRRGFDAYTLRRVAGALLYGPTSKRGVWKKAEIAQLLLPPPAPARAAEPGTPREFVEALSLAARGPAGPDSGRGAEALRAARRLLALIEDQDVELTRLNREADPAEATRLEERLKSLAGADDSESRQLRELIGQQISLLGRMAERLEAARKRRERLAGMMRELWRCRSQGRLRELCAEVDDLLPTQAPSGDERTATRAR